MPGEPAPIDKGDVPGDEPAGDAKTDRAVTAVAADAPTAMLPRTGGSAGEMLLPALAMLAAGALLLLRRRSNAVR